MTSISHPTADAQQSVHQTYYERVTPNFLQPNEENGAFVTTLKVIASVALVFPTIAYLIDTIVSCFNSSKAENLEVKETQPKEVEETPEPTHWENLKTFFTKSYHVDKCDQFTNGKMEFAKQNKLYTLFVGSFAAVAASAAGYAIFAIGSRAWQHMPSFNSKECPQLQCPILPECGKVKDYQDQLQQSSTLLNQCQDQLQQSQDQLQQSYKTSGCPTRIGEVPFENLKPEQLADWVLDNYPKQAAGAAVIGVGTTVYQSAKLLAQGATALKDKVQNCRKPKQPEKVN